MPPDPVSKGGLKAEVWALGPGCPPQGCEMRFVGSGWDGLWETTATLPRLPDPEDNKKDEGRQDFEIKWKTATGGDTFANVHHPYIADEKSGPVVYMKLTKPDTTYANSLQVGSRTVQIDVGIAPPLKPAEAGEPPILLRFGSKAGSLNQMIDCDFKAQPADEIRDGCQQSYQINRRGGSCPPWLKNNLPYDPDKSYSETPFPPDCVEANPGDVTSMATGLQARFVTPAPPRVGCPPNRWQEFRLQGKLPPDNDPRYVTLTVTDFGQFDSSGLAVVPVRVFAGFYITGWFESSQVDTCADNDPPPPPICGTKSQWPPPDPDTVDGCDPAHKDNQGNVWGYFVTNVIEAPAGSESQELCEFDELGICLGVLTR
jgi:hypothetical protein